MQRPFIGKKNNLCLGKSAGIFGSGERGWGASKAKAWSTRGGEGETLSSGSKKAQRSTVGGREGESAEFPKKGGVGGRGEWSLSFVVLRLRGGGGGSDACGGGEARFQWRRGEGGGGCSVCWDAWGRVIICAGVCRGLGVWGGGSVLLSLGGLSGWGGASEEKEKKRFYGVGNGGSAQVWVVCVQGGAWVHSGVAPGRGGGVGGLGERRKGKGSEGRGNGWKTVSVTKGGGTEGGVTEWG